MALKMMYEIAIFVAPVEKQQGVGCYCRTFGSIQSGAGMLASEEEPKRPGGSRLETTITCRYFPRC